MKKLTEIRAELKVKKSLFNSHGRFHYRSVEEILEAFKPFEKKYEVQLTITDDLVQIGDRYYVKSTARIKDLSDIKIFEESTGLAREAEEQKGMNSAQLTGSTSSYARKRALEALFLLDDSKEVDSVEDTTEAKRMMTEEEFQKSKEWLKKNTGKLDVLLSSGLIIPDSYIFEFKKIANEKTN